MTGTWIRNHVGWTILIVLAIIVVLMVFSVVMLSAGEGSSPAGT